MIILVLPDIATEDRLMVRARRGNNDALRDIYQSYFPSVFRYIRLRVEDTYVAEDLTSAVFIQLVESIRANKAPKQSLRGWLFQVARNEIADHYGKSKRMTMTTLDEWVADSGVGDLEFEFMREFDADRARRALNRLSPEQQEVLILRFGQGLSLQETAEIMGKQTNAVKQLQFRGVSSLRRILVDAKGDRPHA